MLLSICLSVCLFVRSSVAFAAWRQHAETTERPTPPVSHMFFPVQNNPREIYACGGGLLVVSVNAPLLLNYYFQLYRWRVWKIRDIWPTSGHITHIHRKLHKMCHSILVHNFDKCWPTVGLGKFATRCMLYFPSRVQHVATLPCEIYNMKNKIDWLTDWLYSHNQTLHINSDIENYNVQDRKE